MTQAANDNSIDLFAVFATDEEAEKRGVETEIDGCGTTKFTIAKIGNENYLRLARPLLKKNQATLKPPKGNRAAEKAAEEKAKEIEIELFAKTILLNWTGTINYNGEKLAYSYENAKKLLSHKGFRNKVSDIAGEDDLFKVVKDEDLEEDLGN